MVFVRDSGEEVGETRIDLKNPHHLLMPYTQSMFASYLFNVKPKTVLIVGMGGGAMVQFLTHHEPNLQVDAIEIDPAVVKIADELFATKPAERVRIMTIDGFDYLRNTENRYDVIYMDAFLKPSRDTDRTGVPLRLKTTEFLKQIQSKLKGDGVVVFNLNQGRTTGRDVDTIRKSFPLTYVFRVGGSRNLIVVGSIAKTRVRISALTPVARELDQRFNANFSFQTILKRLIR